MVGLIAGKRNQFQLFDGLTGGKYIRGGQEVGRYTNLGKVLRGIQVKLALQGHV